MKKIKCSHCGKEWGISRLKDNLKNYECPHCFSKRKKAQGQQSQ